MKITDVEAVQKPQEECLEGEHLRFKANVRGWKSEIRKERCQQLLDKNDHNLRRALLRPLWKDVLLIPQAWYPEDKPRYETQGWWYVPADEILGRANPAEHFTNWQSMQVQKDEKKAEDNAGIASLRRAKQTHQALEGKEKKQRTKGRLWRRAMTLPDDRTNEWARACGLQRELDGM